MAEKTEPTILDEAAVSEIEARAAKATIGPWVYFGEPDDNVFWGEIRSAADEGGFAHVADTPELDERGDDFEFIAHAREDIPALCRTVKHLRERVQLLDSRWCECGHTKDKHGFFSDHDECYECDQESPDLCCEWRPVARPDTQLEHLQSQLEQLRAENERLRELVRHMQFPRGG